MDQERERIQEDLRGVVSGDVRCDDVFLQLYSSDASIYEVRPLAVVRPRGVSDVIATVRYAMEEGLAVHPRGAGTGLAGEALGPGIVVDFSYSMRRLLEIGDTWARFQSGLVHAQLNRALKQSGRVFGPDPATSLVSTMGSVIALDSSGSRWLKHGSARSHVESVEVVLGDGNLVTLGKHSVAEATEYLHQIDPQAEATAQTVVHRIVHRVAEILKREETVIEAHSPKSLVNTCGYQLKGLLNGDELDLAKLIAGSEGTLGLITEAKVSTDPLPRIQGVALLFFERLEQAATASKYLSQVGATACDLMDRRLLTIAREQDPRYARLIPEIAEAMLLVEWEGETAAEVREALQQICSRVQRKRKLAFSTTHTLEKDEMELYWHLVNNVIPRLYRLEGATRPIPIVEDVAVPPLALSDFLVNVQNVLKEHEITASVFGHVGHGQLHIRPFVDLSNPDHARKMHSLASQLYEHVAECGGTISGEHGDGLSRTWFVRQQYGPLFEVFKAIKRTFDPNNTLNPGKVVAEIPQPLTKNLRPVVAQEVDEDENPLPVLNPQLHWEVDDLAYTARNCNGCGRCRTQMHDERMCPIFRFAPREEASPRSKANLVRGVLTGRLGTDSLQNEDLKQVADLCVHCHQCRLECPATVDIPKLMVEAKAQYVETNGLRSTDWYLSRLDRVAFWASKVRSFANWAMTNRQVRWLGEKLFGLAQGRKLPKLSARNFMKRAARQRLTRPSRHTGRKVVYFVDDYANWFDASLGEALVAVMEHNGVAVYVPSEQLPSGMTSVSLGAVEHARKLAHRNVSLLAEAVRQGYHIVTTEPSAALCLTREYLQLLDDDDARLVAENTSDVTSFLWSMHEAGRLELDLSPVNAVVGYHLPCHIRAVDERQPGFRLLQLIPGLTVEFLDKGCSGMAGTFGLKRDNYRSSLRAGWGLISSMREPTVQCGTTECSACKIQMEQGTTKPTLHPIKLLALAYGLMPQFSLSLTKRSEELTVT